MGHKVLFVLAEIELRLHAPPIRLGFEVLLQVLIGGQKFMRGQQASDLSVL